MRSILTRRSERRARWGGRVVRAQSAPSELATTEVAWHAPLQNSRPTLTHLEAGAGGMYGGGGPRGRESVPALGVGAKVGAADAAGLTLEGLPASSLRAMSAVGGGADVDGGAMGVATRPGGAPANITNPP